MASCDSRARIPNQEAALGASCMPQSKCLRALLEERLERQGVEPPHMVGFLRELTKLIKDCPEIQPLALNERLQYLGWSDVAVDYQSVQLAAVCLQDE